jgi:hypothetical protein
MPANVHWKGPMATPRGAHKYIAVKARPGIKDHTERKGRVAELYLNEAKANPAEPILHELGRTEIEVQMRGVDGRVILRVHPSAGAASVNALAVEYGHAPSGYFAGTKTRAPAGLYILTRAKGA